MTDMPYSTNSQNQVVPSQSESRIQQETETSQDTSDEKEVMYDIGILLVHGIGQQKRGDTLVHFGDPLINWMRKWIAGNPSPIGQSVDSATNMGQVDVLDSELHDSSSPPHSSVRLTLILDGTSHRSSWLMAESWWADSFATPRFQDLAYWGFTVVPWVVTSYFGAQFSRTSNQMTEKILNSYFGRQIISAWEKVLPKSRKRPDGWSSLAEPNPNMIKLIFGFILTPVGIIGFILGIWALILAYSLISAFLSIIILFLTILLLILMVFPVKVLQSAAIGLQQILAAFLGDSYVLLTSPIQAASIIGKVSRDLDWIAKRSKAIAVIAHSQGAAIVHEVLRLSKLPDLRNEKINRGALNTFRDKNFLLVTFGSGINLLEALRTAITSEKNKWLGWQSIGGLSTITLMILLIVLGLIQTHISGLELAFLLVGVNNLIAGILAYNNTNKGSQNFAPKNRFGMKLKWLDFYSSLDPVPNGPLFDEKQALVVDEVKTRKVHNQASIWSDHTSYWQNQEEFLSIVAREICKMTNMPLDHLNPFDQKRLEVATERRRWRVSWLGGARMVAFIFGLILPIALWKELEIIGTAVRGGIAAMNIKYLSLLSDPLLKGIDLVGAKAAGALSLIVAVIIGFQLMYWTWRWWNGIETKHYFERVDYSLELTFILFMIEGLFLFDIALIMAMNWTPVLWKLGGDAAGILLSPFYFFFLWWGIQLLLSPFTFLIRKRKFSFFFSFFVTAFQGVIATLLAFPFLSWILVAVPMSCNLALLPQPAVVSPGGIFDHAWACLHHSPGGVINGVVDALFFIAIAFILVTSRVGIPITRWLIRKGLLAPYE